MQYLIVERAGLANHPHAVAEVNGLADVRSFLAGQPGRALEVFVHAQEFEHASNPVALHEDRVNKVAAKKKTVAKRRK